jgi:hypothetical protein
LQSGKTALKKRERKVSKTGDSRFESWLPRSAIIYQLTVNWTEKEN